jgi:hypothetical protein
VGVEFLAALLTFASGFILFYLGKLVDKRSVNKAILAEIDRLLVVIADHFAWWKRCETDAQRLAPFIPFTTEIYDKQIKNIGIVDGDYVAQVVRFYGYIKFLNEFQKTRPINSGSSELNGFHAAYLAALNRMLDEHSGAFEAAFSKYDIR